MEDDLWREALVVSRDFRVALCEGEGVFDLFEEVGEIPLINKNVHGVVLSLRNGFVCYAFDLETDGVFGLDSSRHWCS